jgi:hypothetical protein
LTSQFNIPTNISAPTINLNTSFLLLNNEFVNQTNLFGFLLYGAVNGTINIQVNIKDLK